MGVRLGFWSLKPALDSESPLQEIESGPHFSDSPVVASHIIESHCLSKLVVLTEFLRFLEEVQGTINIFLFQIVDSQDVADFTELLATLGEGA